MDGKIHSIETFGLVDGPGVRYVLFCKVAICVANIAIIPKLGALMMRNLPFRQRMHSTRHISIRIIGEKNGKPNGGITVSGGEPLLQIDFVTEFFKLAKEKGVHTTLDSSGSCFYKRRAFLLQIQ